MAVPTVSPVHLEPYGEAVVDAFNGPQYNLPPGGCNYVDLTHGHGGAKCGCRRFWLMQSAGAADQLDEIRRPLQSQQKPPPPNAFVPPHQPYQANLNGGRDGAGTAAREPLGPRIDVTQGSGDNTPRMSFSAFSPAVPLSFVHDFAEEPHNKPDNQTAPASIPDTLQWNDYIQSPPAMPALAPPSQPAGPSQTTSTTSSTRLKYQRPFGGTGLGTLDAARTQSSRATPNQPLAVPNARPATPSLQQDATQMEPRAVSFQKGDIPDTLASLGETVQLHDQRLGKLESASFCGPAQEECDERHDTMDYRVTELEQRMDGVERTLEEGSIAGRARAEDDDATTKSGISAAANAAGSFIHSQDIMDRLSMLQRQVSRLQTLHPSHADAWVVEVVFLPFPLKRLWQDLSQFNNDAEVSNGDWTQMPMSHSAGTVPAGSPGSADWLNQSQRHESQWLHPRAGADRSTQVERLKSRGFIRLVSFRGSDARSVQTAIHEAFGDLFRAMQILPRRQFPTARSSKYTCLEEAWLPLRKVHKDSRLRFLSPADMITPATWDLTFIHSVAMRAALPKLYITHADAYVQDYEAYAEGWTWQKIREMDRVYPDVTEDIPEADALEQCWQWIDQLDEPPTAATSLNMRQGSRSRRVSMSPSVAIHGEQPWRSVSPALARGQSPMLMMSGRRAPRPPHIRTVSVPTVPQLRSSPAPQRRVVSHEQHNHRSSPVQVRYTATNPYPGVTKRQRTRSPSYARYTPRWTASPSPMYSIADRQRGTTPFGYPTPHSHAPLQEVQHMRSGSVARSIGERERTPLMEFASDEVFDVEIYEGASDGSHEEEEEEEEDDDDDSSDDMVITAVQPRQDRQGDRQLPEDEPWPGIEDGENIDPDGNASSVPSEYPTTQQAWPAADFQIHEDQEGE